MNSPESLAGQVLILGIEGPSADPGCLGLLSRIQPGGLIYFTRNILSEVQFSAFVQQTRDALAEPLPLLALDLEGGTVDRFRELLTPLPSVEHAVAAGVEQELGRVAGRELLAFGLNVDFAPVLDLGLPASRSVLTTRTAGPTPSDVAAFGERFLAGLSDSRILGCGKHFPGLGGGTLDSHLDMPCIERSLESMWVEDILPYRRLAQSLPMVMVAHAWYPELERDLGWTGAERPASLSTEIVTGLLRDRIGFEGLIVCDDLEMGGVLKGRTIEGAAIGAILAGCDLLLVCRDAGNSTRVHSALAKECERSSAFRLKLEAAAARIATVKRKQGWGRDLQVLNRPAVSQVRSEVANLAMLVNHKLSEQVDNPPCVEGQEC